MVHKTLILSDIHLGNGGPYDIYAGGAALPALIDAEAGPGLRLIFNGDVVDFLLNDEPLQLNAGRAVALARAMVAHSDTAAVMAAVGRVLAAGGEVRIRLGNHDVELALPEVQAVFREATGQPAEVAARLIFEDGMEPGQLDIGGAKVLYAHGEHNDQWNRVDYPELLNPTAQERFTYAPGSKLVKRILNPLKREHGMRFADLLKPDFNGAVMAALAVDAAAVKVAAPSEVASLAASVFRRSFEPSSFEIGEPDELGALEELANEADLCDEEREAMADAVDGRSLSFGVSDELAAAASKLARRAFRGYANVHRMIGGGAGEAYFSLVPSGDEWKEARRLAKKYSADVVITGHTHAARWHDEEDVVYANTGTWIGLMKLPAAEATSEVWEDFLSKLRANPALDPARGPAVPVLTRFTGVEIIPRADGGAVVSLVEWRGGKRLVLGEARVSRSG